MLRFFPHRNYLIKAGSFGEVFWFVFVVCLFWYVLWVLLGWFVFGVVFCAVTNISSLYYHELPGVTAT